MNKLLLSCLFIGTTLMLNAQRSQVNIKGKVTDGASALKGVNIQVANTENGTVTDVDGNYDINVEEGTTLRYTHVGYAAVEIIVEDIDRTLNIVLLPEANQLDNVTVTKTKPRKTQKELFNEYNTNPNLIKTMFGILDDDAVGYSMRALGGDSFNQGARDLADALQGRFAGLNIGCNKVTGMLVVNMRSTGTLGGANSIPLGNAIVNGPSDEVAFDVDGVVFEELPCQMIDITNIERIAVVPSFAGTALYGSIARGGVIIINTKTGNFSPGANGIANYDQARLRNNVYENDALSKEATANDVPGYLKELRAATDKAASRTIYDAQIATYGNSFHYILDAYGHFAARWKDRDLADAIVADNWELFGNNPVALKALAYLYQAEGRVAEANKLYREIFILRPNYAQSYMDMANSYREVGDYQKAAGIYARYGYLLEQGFLRAEGDLGTIMERDLNNLVALKGEGFLDRSELKKLVLDDEFQGTRIVFEWNDGEAEFELQFVNPEGNYFKTERSLLADADKVRDAKISGFSSEEHLIDDSIRGTWQVNAKYLGNKSLTPTYLKATVYHNYGSASQRMETKVFKLDLRNVNLQLFTVSNTTSVVSN